MICDDPSITSSLNANFSFALAEDLNQASQFELLAGFHPDKLSQPFDPDHVCHVFLKCRIMLNDYIKSLENDTVK